MTTPKRILTVQDISCVGQCSITVALPVISACGIETSVLPSAVLSTHTVGFEGYTFRDLTEDIPAIKEHWKREGISFDAIYTGYLGSRKQISYVRDVLSECAKDGAIKIVDPAMADSGRLYPGFDAEFVKAMASLCSEADYIIPNLTEACLLTDSEYKTEYDRAYIDTILERLSSLCHGTVILTGVSYEAGKTGIVIYQNRHQTYYEHELLPKNCHGTGDLYASVFVGALLRGRSPIDSAVIAADFTLECIRETLKDENHWYGTRFEPHLHKLSGMIKNN